MNNNDDLLKNYIESQKRQTQIIEEKTGRKRKLVSNYFYQNEGLKNKIDNLNQAIQKYPNEVKYYENRLEIFIREATDNDFLGKTIEAKYFWELALKDIDIILDLVDNNYFYEKLFSRGQIKNRLWDLHGAYEDYKKALEIINNLQKNDLLVDYEKDNINYFKKARYLDCALIKTKMKEYESAINYYDKALKLDECYIFYIGRAIAKLFIMEEESAFNDLDTAIKLNEEESLESLKEYQQFYNQSIPKTETNLIAVLGEKKFLYDYKDVYRDSEEELKHKKVSSFLNQYLSTIS